MAETELLFKAFADTTRQRLLQVLCAEELSVSELVGVLDQPQSTISRHLKVLRDAGLLLDRRCGPTVLYSAWPLDLQASERSETGPEEDHNGLHRSTAVLRNRLLDWISHQDLAADLRDRLQRAVRERHRQGNGFFEAVGARWDQLRIEAFGDVFHLEALTWLLPTDWTVADVGTGTGYLLGVLAARFRQVIAIDPSATMLDVARSRPECVGRRNIAFREGSLEDLPLGSNELDLAIACLVLHHVPDPARAMAELRRCIRPGGRLLVIEQETHEDLGFHERMGDRWRGFAPEQLVGWAREAGFARTRTIPLRTPRPASRRRGDSPPLFVLIAQDKEQSQPLNQE